MHRGGDYGSNDFVDTELRAQGEAIEVFPSPIFSFDGPPRLAWRMDPSKLR
jgi:hypothetical protein